MKKVTVYSRTGCHLCEIAIDLIKSVKQENNFSLEIKLIDNNSELEKEYGEQVPVILIDEKGVVQARVSEPDDIQQLITDLKKNFKHN